jgi:GNAT superfamily N-acetyltransferase
MKFTFRRADLSNEAELRTIAEIDAGIPPLYDADFRNDAETIAKELDFFKNKLTGEDFFDVAVDTQGRIVGFHLVKKVPYLRDLFAGAVYTLWVDPIDRNNGVGTILKQRGEAWARQSKLDHLYTWIHSRNQPSLGLNEKLGYEIVNYKLKKKL